MNTRIGLLGILLCVSAAFSQEVYGTYGHYRSITVNTSSTGANVAATQYKFPVLIRLNSSNFNFALAKGDGRDVRFSKTNTLPLKYQIENWDSAGQSASIWVLLDTVLGNSNVAKFRMYYGKAGVADSSKGSAVFDTGNGFQGVALRRVVDRETTRTEQGDSEGGALDLGLGEFLAGVAHHQDRVGVGQQAQRRATLRECSRRCNAGTDPAILG